MGAGVSSKKKKKSKRKSGGSGTSLKDEISQAGFQLYEQGKLNEAKSLYEKAVAMHEAERGPSGQKYYRYLSHLATIHVDQGNFEVARDMFFKGNPSSPDTFIYLLILIPHTLV